MLASDILVLIIVLTLLFRETLRGDRQGCAWALVFASRQRRNAAAAAHVTQSDSVSVATTVPIERDLGLDYKREGDPDAGKARVTDADASQVPASPVSAYTEAIPTYSRRWMAADAVIALAVILLLLALVSSL